MKPEGAFEIQTHMKLLDAGYYDEYIYKYINGNGRKNWMKKFSVNSFFSNSPPIEASRMWWFKEVLHPELFTGEKFK